MTFKAFHHILIIPKIMGHYDNTLCRKHYKSCSRSPKLSTSLPTLRAAEGSAIKIKKKEKNTHFFADMGMRPAPKKEKFSIILNLLFV